MIFILAFHILFLSIPSLVKTKNVKVKTQNLIRQVYDKDRKTRKTNAKSNRKGDTINLL